MDHVDVMLPADGAGTEIGAHLPGVIGELKKPSAPFLAQHPSRRVQINEMKICHRIPGQLFLDQALVFAAGENPDFVLLGHLGRACPSFPRLRPLIGPAGEGGDEDFQTGHTNNTRGRAAKNSIVASAFATIRILSERPEHDSIYPSY